MAHVEPPLTFTHPRPSVHWRARAAIASGEGAGEEGRRLSPPACRRTWTAGSPRSGVAFPKPGVAPPPPWQARYPNPGIAATLGNNCGLVTLSCLGTLCPREVSLPLTLGFCEMWLWKKILLSHLGCPSGHPKGPSQEVAFLQLSCQGGRAWAEPGVHMRCVRCAKCFTTLPFFI